MERKLRQRRNPVYWADAWDSNMNNKFSSLPLDSGDIVFIGTSLTYNFPFAELFPGITIRNRGIPYNQSRHVLARINPILARKPGMIFLEIGINDFVTGINMDSLYENYKKIIFLAKSADAKLYVESVFPAAFKYKYLIPSIRSFNDRLQAYCEMQGVSYIDLYTALSNNGELDHAFTSDGIHLNANGYRVWKEKTASLFH